MLKINSLLEEYILAHTEPESELLKELTRQTYSKILRPRMLSGHLQGQILAMISKMINPLCILEIGTYTGYSAICLAFGLKKDGIIHTIEINDELADFTQSFINQSEYKEQIKLHIGNALGIIPNLKITPDLVFIDGDKREYINYFNCVIGKVRQGGFIIADNILWDGKVIEEIKPNDEQTIGILEFNNFVQNNNYVENVILPIRDGLMVVRKK